MSNPIQQSPIFPVTRTKVRELLTRSRAFRALPEPQRRELAHDMVKVATYIAGGESGSNVPGGVALIDENTGETRLADKVVASPLADATSGADIPPKGVPEPGEVAGEDFVAAAGTAGVQNLTDAISGVNFPEFVGGLIDGVFMAIVDASIKQMNAYGELVKNVAKSVDQFMKDNVSKNQARDHLVEQYPEHLQLDLDGDEPTVTPRDDADEENMPDFFSDLGLPSPVDDLDEDTVEEVLVPAARRRMAMDRQQLLATMVLMGINRIIVTNGKISASVVFKLDTTDSIERGFTKTTDQYKSTYSRKRPGFWSWFKPSVTRESSYGRFKVTTTQDEDSEATSKLKVQLRGNVDVNFRSETFPLERMTDILIVDQIRAKAPGQASAAAPPTEETANT